MTKIQILEREVRSLDRAKLAAFRSWFRKFDSKEWDLQIERDARAGRLDAISGEAAAAHRAGKTRPL
mgnify:CR=1 FL=1